MTVSAVRTNRRVNFEKVAAAALARADHVILAFVPTARREGPEFVVLNPNRTDHRPGSFKINAVTGAWADFADASARGRDLISLTAYLTGRTQRQAALDLAEALGVDPWA